MNNWNETIAVIEKEVESFEQRAQAGRQAIELLRKIYGSSEIQTNKIALPQTVSGKKLKTKRTKKSENIAENIQIDKPLKKYGRKSKAKNMEKGIRLIDGKYEANYYASGIGVKYLGRFDTLKLARSARANYAEQLENNPDRVRSGKKMVKVYECTHCHVTFKSKPAACPGCIGTSFKEAYEEE